MKEISLIDIMRHLEARDGNQDYFVEGRKLYKGRGYRRVKELLKAMRLLGILNHQGKTGDK